MAKDEKRRFSGTLAVCLMKMRNFQTEILRILPGGSLGKRLFMKAKNVMKDEFLPTVRKDASIKFVINETTRGKLDNVLSVDQNGFGWNFKR